MILLTPQPGLLLSPEHLLLALAVGEIWGKIGFCSSPTHFPHQSLCWGSCPVLTSSSWLSMEVREASMASHFSKLVFQLVSFSEK